MHVSGMFVSRCFLSSCFFVFVQYFRLPDNENDVYRRKHEMWILPLLKFLWPASNVATTLSLTSD